MIYSSGSVPAQKLLFGHTTADPADLRPFISDWFDTVNAGPKTDSSSYAKIAAAYSHTVPYPENWLFLSDNPREIRPALEAGMQALLVQRPGNPDVADPEYADLLVTAVEDFNGLGVFET